MTYDHGEDAGLDTMIGESDVIGLYPESRAAGGIEVDDHDRPGREPG